MGFVSWVVGTLESMRCEYCGRMNRSLTHGVAPDAFEEPRTKLNGRARTAVHSAGPCYPVRRSGQVAQLEEHGSEEPGVGGSIPSLATPEATKTRPQKCQRPRSRAVRWTHPLPSGRYLCWVDHHPEPRINRSGWRHPLEGSSLRTRGSGGVRPGS